MAARRPPGVGGARLGRGAEVAWEAALSMVLGAVLGMWIDSRAGTTPLFLVVFLALGLAAAVRRLLRFAKAQAAADAEAARAKEPQAGAEAPRERDPH